MIAFTILGLLVFWVWCFGVGYALAASQDRNKRMDEVSLVLACWVMTP